ncbi:hypothetical protein [Halorarum salinum]|uniref:Uncharacterized protein n=1 Tax=Halorarum salinum TaxID=2743089 RepID=A0A7D5QHH0_9EURY|nr:hypothetical protein [Halobaculum salinum]QLG62224.1 hypothetical protein HUG12_10990 [Halobaculum salinum]
MLVTLVDALTSDEELENLPRFLREHDVPLVLVAALQPRPGVGAVPELQDAVLVVVDIQPADRGRPAPDVPEDLQHRVPAGSAPRGAVPIEREEVAGVRRRELLVGGLLLVRGLDGVNREVKAEVTRNTASRGSVCSSRWS